MISMDVGEDVNIPIEGIVSSLSKIINDYVSEIDLSHLLLFYALLIKWRSITIYPLFKQLNHQIISHMHHQTHIVFGHMNGFIIFVYVEENSCQT